MRVLVFGCHGWIATYVLDELLKRNYIAITTDVRADDEKAVEEEILRHSPTHILSLIGRTHGSICGKEYTTIDYLEQKGKLVENVRDNLYSPIVLAILAKKHNIHFTYLGTGCIFEYDQHHPFGKEENGFTEESLPNFFGSSYSTVKGIL